MRVIAGRLGGRTFDSPRTHRTHPMSDRVRGALFNTLGPLDGLSVLDAFSGSGACGIEAASRGAASVLSVEVDMAAGRTIAENIDALDLGAVMTLRRQNVATWSRDNPDALFDVVLADPPYDAIKPELLERLSAHVRPDGVFAVSLPGRADAPVYPGLTLLQCKNYGDAQLVFCRRAA